MKLSERRLAVHGDRRDAVPPILVCSLQPKALEILNASAEGDSLTAEVVVVEEIHARASESSDG